MKNLIFVNLSEQRLEKLRALARQVSSTVGREVGLDEIATEIIISFMDEHEESNKKPG